MSVRAWAHLRVLALLTTVACAAGKDSPTDVADTDTVDTDVADTVDTDRADTADTGAVDTDAADTDAVDTDIGDTDGLDTDVVDTDSGAFSVTIAPVHPTPLDDLVATVHHIPPGIGGMAGLLIVWSGPAPGPFFGATVANTFTEAGDSWTVTVHPVVATGIADVQATVVIGP